MITPCSICSMKHSPPWAARLLKKWVTHPLLSPEKIQSRQQVIEELLKESTLAQDLIPHLKLIRDLERLITRISSGYTTPRDLTALRFSLEKVQPVKALMEKLHSPYISLLISKFTDVTAIIERIQTAIVDEPPVKVTEGDIFREGYSSELDELRDLRKNSQTWIANYQTSIKETTGIKNLKVSYNKAFGYYIEVSKGQAGLMPETFQRRQTLVNAERFISPELKEYEDKILNAQDRIGALEHALYQEIRQEIGHLYKAGSSDRKSDRALRHPSQLKSRCKFISTSNQSSINRTT